MTRVAEKEKLGKRTKKRKFSEDDKEYEGSDQEIECGDEESDQESSRRKKRFERKDTRNKNCEDDEEDESDQDQDQVDQVDHVEVEKSKEKVSEPDHKGKRNTNIKGKDNIEIQLNYIFVTILWL